MDRSGDIVFHIREKRRSGGLKEKIERDFIVFFLYCLMSRYSVSLVLFLWKHVQDMSFNILCAALDVVLLYSGGSAYLK